MLNRELEAENVIEWCRLALSMDSLTDTERAQYEDDLQAAEEFLVRQEAKRLEAHDDHV